MATVKGINFGTRIQLPQGMRSYSQQAIDFDYALDGKNKDMNPEQFVQQLHNRGLTVADSIYRQCEIETQKAYEEMKNLGLITENDWRYLQNILTFRTKITRGHYDESNVTFSSYTDDSIKDIVKDVLKKADVPFKITVIITKAHSNSKAIARVSKCGYDKEFPINTDFNWNSYYSGKNITLNVNLELYRDFFQRKPTEQRYVLAHEATHILNSHSIQKKLFARYLSITKEIEEKIRFNNDGLGECVVYIKNSEASDQEILKKHFKILDTLCEHHADLAPLAVTEYTEGSLEFCQSRSKKLRGNGLYFTGAELYDFATRALELHKVEEKILKSK